MGTTVDFSTVDWRQDRITRKYVEQNRERLSVPSKMIPRELGDAVTYCKSICNPYADELMRRSGHLDAFYEALTDKERADILRKSCNYHGFTLC